MNSNNSIQWLNAEKGNSRKFIVAHVMVADNRIRVKFPIDSKTFNGFETVLNERPFKDKYGVDYSYWCAGYSVDRSNDTFSHYIEIRLGDMRHKAKAQCSEVFCQNLKWLKTIEKASDLNEIAVKE